MKDGENVPAPIVPKRLKIKVTNFRINTAANIPHQVMGCLQSPSWGTTHSDSL